MGPARSPNQFGGGELGVFLNENNTLSCGRVFGSGLHAGTGGGRMAPARSPNQFGGGGLGVFLNKNKALACCREPGSGLHACTSGGRLVVIAS